MTSKKILKLRFDSWNRYTTWHGQSYTILPTFTNQLMSGDQARSIESRIKTTSCPICKTSLRIEEQDPDAPRDATLTRTFYHLCDSCGFWRFELQDRAHLPYYTIPNVKRFDYEAAVPSMSYLSKEIHRNRERLYGMNPTGFEVFVGSVLSDFLDCEVHHIGRSGDDGVDLIALVGDSPLMIQVKRRESPSATEGIDVVKLLFASAFVQGSSNGMVVTSAKRFTRPARIWSESRKLTDSGFHLDLVDMNSLMSMVDAVASKDEVPPWHRHRDRERAAQLWPGSLHSYAHKLLHFADFDAVILGETDTSLLAFEHADLTKVYSIERQGIESYLRAPDLRFAEVKDRCNDASIHVFHDESAIRLADSLPFGTRQALVGHWESSFPEEISDSD